MKKVSRDLLKDLVKECLVEILSEGLAGSSTPHTTSQVVTESKARKRKQTSRRHPSELMNVAKPKKAAALEKRIIAASGGNEIMESILRDTAANTLPTMVAAESKNSNMGMVERMTRGDQATRAMAGADPMDIFEGSSKWASLAFAGKKQDR